MRAERCANDNHGRAIVTVRCCPNCGEIVNGRIASRACSEPDHAQARRARFTFCMHCGEQVRAEARR